MNYDVISLLPRPRTHLIRTRPLRSILIQTQDNKGMALNYNITISLQ